MINRIEVNGIRIYAHHGCLAEETLIGGHYLVDITLSLDFSEAAKNDLLSKTIDYVLVNRVVSEEMAVPSKLIEHAGLRIYDRLKHETPLSCSIQVKITKLSPPINGDVDKVTITIGDE